MHSMTSESQKRIPMPVPADKVNASVRMPEEMYRRVLEEAERNMRTATNEICFRLKQSFDRDDKATTQAEE
jgi:Arc-like DNA binding domain